MFEKVTLRGSSASLLWGYRTAVKLKSWTIVKNEGKWTLKGVIERVDAFQARQTPLLFTAPREKGFWAWPLISLQLGQRELVAQLGPPEQ